MYHQRHEPCLHLDLPIHFFGPIAVWCLPCRIDASTSALLKTHLAQILESQRVKIVADLSEVTAIDTVGMGVMLSILKTVREHQGEMVLASVGAQLASLFDATHLDRVFAIVDKPSVGVELLQLPRTVHEATTHEPLAENLEEEQ